jgi:hypothetical protein
MTIRMISNDKGNAPGKLSDAEPHFTDARSPGSSLLASVWQRRGDGARNVTFPARSFSLNGERCSFALLRPTQDTEAQERIRDLILEAYAAQVLAETGEVV